MIQSERNVWSQDFSPEALPQSTSAREKFVHGAAKFTQIGPDAGANLLTQTFTGANIADQKAIVILDTNAKYGDILLGWCAVRNSLPTTTFYFGVCDDQVEKTWLEATLKDHLIALYDSGEMRAPPGASIRDPFLIKALRPKSGRGPDLSTPPPKSQPLQGGQRCQFLVKPPRRTPAATIRTPCPRSRPCTN